MTEILNLLSLSWTGLIAVVVWKGPDYLNVWLASRRIKLRIGIREIDAPNQRQAECFLLKLECISDAHGTNPQHTSDLPKIIQ